MFKGYFCALITPFKDGKVDENAFQNLVEWQIAEGVHGLLACGTTGESPTLSIKEHNRVIEMCIEAAAGRIPVLAGAGTYSTSETVARAQHAQEAAADAVLVVTPYYNKPTQEGLYQHFKAVNDAIDIPILIYNIPPRSVVDMSVETMKRLAALANIVGVKDATADLSRVSKQRQAMGPDFYQMSGEDATVLAALVNGGHGCISVTANVAPRACADFYETWESRDPDGALAIQDRLMPLHQALFIESSPGPVKYAASLLDLCEETVRLPIAQISDSAKIAVSDAMRSAGILN